MSVIEILSQRPCSLVGDRLYSVSPIVGSQGYYSIGIYDPANVSICIVI